jgi:hypothetical protein
VATADLKIVGFDKLQKMLDPATIEDRLKDKIKIATETVGIVASDAVKEGIYGTGGFRQYLDNRPMTVALKGSDRPLVDNGDLAQSITYDVEDWDRVIVGVLRDKIVKEDDGETESIKSIAGILHAGVTIKVTDKMRGYFAYKHKQYLEGKEKRPWMPLKPSTKTMVVKPRPFMRVATLKKMQAEYQKIWSKAVQKAITG